VKLRLLVVGLFLLCAAVPGADSPKDLLTDGLRNGRYWLTLSDGLKIGFVVGFSEGFTNGYAVASPGVTDMSDSEVEALVKMKDDKNPAALGVTTGDIVTMLDQFYASPEVRPFPIWAALKIAKAKFRGDTQAEIDRLMDFYRKLFLQAPAPAQPAQ